MNLLVALSIVVLVDVVSGGPLAGARLGRVEEPHDLEQPADGGRREQVTP